MPRRRRPTYNEYSALLGMTSIDEFGMPIPQNTGPIGDGLASNELRRQERNPLYRTTLGDFSTQTVYDPTARYGVMYRGEDVNLQDEIYNSQRWSGAVVNGLGRLIATTATKAASSAAFLASLPYEAFRGMTTDAEGNFISRAADNGLSNLISGLEDEVKNAMPVFKSSYYDEGNVFQKATTIEFWMDDVVDGVAFALSSYLGGGFIAKAGAGSKIASTFKSAFTKAGSASGQSGLGLQNITALSRKIDKVTGTALMTSSEAMFEAAGVKKAILENKELVAKYSDEELKQLAAARARDTYLLNMMAIAPTNLFEYSTIFNKTKIIGKSKPASRIAAVDDIGVNTATNLLEDTSKELTGLKAFWQKPKTKLAKEILSNAAAEGLVEENIQYSIQQLGEYMGNYQDDPKGQNRSFLESVSLLLANAGQNVSGLAHDKERATAAVLGGVIGAGQSAISNVPKWNRAFGGDGGILEENKNIQTKKDKIIKDINDLQSNSDLTKLDVWQRTPEQEITARIDGEGKRYVKIGGEEEVQLEENEFNETLAKAGINPDNSDLHMNKPVSGKIESVIKVDELGNPLLDQNKLKTYLSNMERMEVLDDIHQAMSQNPEANATGLQMIKNEKLANMALAHFRSGLGELLFDKLENMKNFSPQELATFGLSPSENIVEQIESAKIYAEHLEEVYNSIHTGLIPDTNLPEDYKINERRKLMAFDRAQRILNIDSLVRKNNARLNSITNELADLLMIDQGLISNNPELYDQLQELRYISQSLMPYTTRTAFGEVDPVTNKDYTSFLNGFRKYKDIINKIGKTIDENYFNRDENNISDLSKISPVNSLRAESQRLFSANEQLLESREAPFKDYQKITNQKVENSARTLANVAGNLFTVGGLANTFNFDKFVPMRTSGFNYFKNNESELMQRYANRGTLTLDLTDETTQEEYENYESRKLAMLKFAQKLQLANRKYIGLAWKDFLVQGGSVGEMLKFILTNDAILSDSDYREILVLMEDKISKYEDLKRGLSEIEELLSPENLDESDLSDEEVEDLEINKANILDQMKEIESLAEFELLNPVDLIEFLWSKTYKNIADFTEEQLKRIIAEEFKNGAEFVISSFENSLEYDNLEEVEKELKKLINLQRVFKNRKELRNSSSFLEGMINGVYYLDFDEDLLDDINTLKEIRKEVIDRLNSKYRAELLSYRDFVEELYDAIGIGSSEYTISEFFPEINALIAPILEEHQQSMEKFAEDKNVDPLVVLKSSILPEGLIYGIIDRLTFADKNTLTTNINNRLKSVADQLRENPNIIKYIKEGGFLEGTDLYNNLENIDSNNVARIVITQMSEKMRGFETGFDRMPNSSIFRYQNHQDLNRLYRELLEEDRSSVTSGAPKEDILKIIKMLKTIKALNYIKNNITQKQSMPVIEAMHSILEAQKEAYDNNNNIELMPPSLKQRIAIQKLLDFIYRPDSKPLVEKGLNYWAYLKGAAGTGKSLIVAKWVFKMIEKVVTPDQIITAGGNKFAAETINKSIPSANGVNTIADLQKRIDELSSKDNPNLRFIIIDEIGAVSYTELIKLRSSIDNLKLKIPNLKVIVLGDPNQITADTTSKPLIEYNHDYNLRGLPEMTIIDPLIIRYRSDDPSIINVQDSFINKSGRVKNVVGKINTTLQTISNSNVQINGSFVESGTASILSLIQNNLKNAPNRSRLVVVSSESAKEVYKNKLTSLLGNDAGGIQILTYVEAQGMTVEEVYVDIPLNENFQPELSNSGDDTARISLYNKAMYTATSRATRFLYVGNIPEGNTITDATLDSQVENNIKNKKLNFDAAIEDLAYQIQYYKKINPDPVVDRSNIPVVHNPESAQPVPVQTTLSTIDPSVVVTQEENEVIVEEEIPTVVDSLEEDNAGIPQQEIPITTTSDTAQDPEDDIIYEQEDDLDPDSVLDVIESEDPLDNTPNMTSLKPLDQELVNSFQNIFTTSAEHLHVQSAAFDDIKYKGFNNENRMSEGLTSYFATEGNDKLEGVVGFKLGFDRANPENFVYVIALPLEVNANNLSERMYKMIATLSKEGYDKLSESEKDKPVQQLNRYHDDGKRTIFSAPVTSSKYKGAILNTGGFVTEDMKVLYNKGDFSPTGVERILQIANIAANNLKIEADIDGIRIKVFSRKSLQKLETSLNKKFKMPVAYGVPYIYIPWKNGATPLLIRLEPQIISENNFGKELSLIREYIDKIKSFEQTVQTLLNKDLKLGHKDFAYYISTMANVYRHFVPNELGRTRDLGYYTIVNDKNEKVKVPKSYTEVLNSAHEHYGRLIKFISGQENDVTLDPETFEGYKSIFQLAHEIDEMVHGKNMNKRQHGGQVQRAFDKVAKSNLGVYFDNSPPFTLLRDERIDEGNISGNISARKLVGRSLLGPINFYKSAINFNSDSLLGSQLSKYLSKLNKRLNLGLTEQDLSNATFTRYINPSDPTNPDRVTFTVSELENLFFGDSSKISMGYGLRVPIQITTFNDKRLSSTQSGNTPLIKVRLSDYLQNNLAGVRPLRMAIGMGNNSEEATTNIPQLPNMNSPITDLTSIINKEDAPDNAPVETVNINDPQSIDDYLSDSAADILKDIKADPDFQEYYKIRKQSEPNLTEEEAARYWLDCL